MGNPKLRDSSHLVCLTLDTAAAGPRSCSKLMGASGTTGSSSQKKNPYRGIKSKEFRWSRSETVDASCLPAYSHLPSGSSCSVLVLLCRLPLAVLAGSWYKLSGLLARALCIKLLLCGHFQFSCGLEVCEFIF